MSFITRPIDAAKTTVNPPISATMVRAVSASSNSGRNRATRKTPAATIVAAWMSALTGVGPSIASGSHVCSGNCALLPAAPAMMPRQMSVNPVPVNAAPPALSRSMEAFGSLRANVTGVSSGHSRKMPRIASRKKRSPKRVMINAFLAAAAALGRVNQNPISR